MVDWINGKNSEPCGRHGSIDDRREILRPTSIRRSDKRHEDT